MVGSSFTLKINKEREKAGSHGVLSLKLLLWIACCRVLFNPLLKNIGVTIAGTGSIRFGTYVSIWVGNSYANMSA